MLTDFIFLTFFRFLGVKYTPSNFAMSIFSLRRI